MSLLIEAKNLSKTVYKQNRTISILTDVSLSLYSGETVSITGASGNGKTTLLHLLGTLDVPSSGTLRFFNKDLENRDLPIFRNQHIGFIFQNFYLLEDDTVLRNILMPALIACKDISKGSCMYKRALELIDVVGLKDKILNRCSTLSGGEKQRVAIARALINQPTILLADEPSGNLDEETSEHIHNLLLSQVSASCGMLIVTHNKKLATRCSREGVLLNGKLSFCKS
ncbi:Lipoprotein-releasing system ATP-binding protein LolD,lipoprotein transporter ATP-binding subunit,Predicted ABC-type transport system involved in lysophospholipase L1 biosynthesis, ATPase component,lipoprotein releasing system, ATP-binding protein,ABC transporter [Chlamydia serpentis]|uniref:ABC transporter domain-containing protein n=1 Tax=Chlamydia serpentis TaxID=1967782 RepID=A0A2R8FAF2_9CHLA|nr:ATP-binding cassette domain-containing protein [Chlamydia serpentis]SPN73399.1 Lipoprotein-releasing system ATP-binding protein LolD,lipoprotein transporter ATP-binding subunit,Predicted ABC-type transport system involved in lysophospholipase L1 biosynthesis, ATPase component,lipoprotein releasing system, ATP-binding protein,ABC transporter [Chlamydia serpentis]